MAVGAIDTPDDVCKFPGCILLWVTSYEVCCAFFSRLLVHTPKSYTVMSLCLYSSCLVESTSFIWIQSLLLSALDVIYVELSSSYGRDFVDFSLLCADL